MMSDKREIPSCTRRPHGRPHVFQQGRMRNVRDAVLPAVVVFAVTTLPALTYRLTTARAASGDAAAARAEAAAAVPACDAEDGAEPSYLPVPQGVTWAAR